MGKEITVDSPYPFLPELGRRYSLQLGSPNGSIILLKALYTFVFVDIEKKISNFNFEVLVFWRQ